MNWLPANRKKWHGMVLRLGLPALFLLFMGVYAMRMPGTSHSGPLPPLSETEQEIRDNLERHVRALGEEIGERNYLRYEALGAAQEYIQSEFESLGLRVALHSFDVDGRPFSNVEATMPGFSDREPVLILGAHYDTVHGSPGANDNGSGVAALLDLARLLMNERPARAIRFVAFVNEEPPFFQTRHMGSRAYARRLRAGGAEVLGMISIETIGYYSDERGSQMYPPGLRLFYPSRGNFIGFVGNVASRRLVRQAIGAFRATTAFPSEGAALPGWIPGVGWSDHWAFWKEGYRAIMVTDTAPFRYPFYHTPQDTPDKLDYGRMARVVSGLREVALALGGDPAR